MKAIAVLDTSVVVSAIGWRGDARNAFRLLAHRGFISVRSSYLTEEWAETVSEMATEGELPNPNWASWIKWLRDASKLVEDPEAKRIVRDAKDNPILALAIAQKASYLVTYDSDLLVLRKPYGVHCIKPREFVSSVLKK
jgi:putative PIN family toxin of toxin-antitoxin system